MLIIETDMDWVTPTAVRYILHVSNIIPLVPQEKMAEMEARGSVVLLVMVDIIPIDLVVDMVIPLVPHAEMMVILQMILMELFQISLPLKKLGDDRHNQCTQQHNQFQQSMIVMNNSLLT